MTALQYSPISIKAQTYAWVNKLLELINFELSKLMKSLKVGVLLTIDMNEVPKIESKTRRYASQPYYITMNIFGK